jgi:hypothetical protein
MAAKRQGASAFGLCCIATELFFANDGGARACDAAPRWPKRSLCTCGMLRPALTPPGNQIPVESASTTNLGN